MTTPSQPTELDKAIEDARFAIREHERLIIKGSNFYPIKESTLGLLIGVAECSKEVEKESSDLKTTLKEALQRLMDAQEAIEQHKFQLKELSQLRTAYKKALEAFEELKWHDLRDSHMASDCFVCERINKALSTPLAIEILKKKH